MAEESAADRLEAIQLSEDEDTVEFEIEVVSSSASSLVPSRASTPEVETEAMRQKIEIDINKSIQSESNKIISKTINKQEQEQEQEQEREREVPLDNESNEPQARDEQLGSGGKIPVDVHERDSPVGADSGQQQVAVEPTFESTDETADQIECPDVERVADGSSVVGHDDLREALFSVETNGKQSIESAAEAPPSGPEGGSLLGACSMNLAAGEEATSDDKNEAQPTEAPSLSPSDWTLVAESAECQQQSETTIADSNQSVPCHKIEPPGKQREEQHLQASEVHNSNEERQSVGGLSEEDHALYKPANSMGPARESATIKGSDQAPEINRPEEKLAPDEEFQDESIDGDISIQIDGPIPSLVEVQAGTLEHDEFSPECRLDRPASEQVVVVATSDDDELEQGDFVEFQLAPRAEMATPTEESSNELVVDKQQVVWSDQLSSSSSLNNFLNLQDSSAMFEDDDLEREFDEEPEFKRRDVQLKRNRNPRDEYELGDELGRGKFGTVFRCVERSSGLKLAAKFMHIRRREDRDDVEREIAIMSELQHKRLLQLYDAFDDGLNEMCLITELVEGGELFERIVDDDFDLTEKKAAIFMRQICEGVEYMHEKRIVHLDMKPENILCLSRTGNRIKLIDFGLARRLDPDKPIRVLFGTPDFAAPEVLAYETVTLETDMWSVGVICYVLLTGLSPFMGDSDMETMANVMRATFDFNDRAFEAISELAKDFIAKLLVRDPNKRLKPADCLGHAWLERGGRPLEAHIRERRKSSLSILLEGHHRLALEQAAALAGSLALNETSPTTPPALQTGLSWRPRHSIAESCASASSHQSLDKRRLKKYVVRRKWHKTVHAIMALGRMGANLKAATAI